MGPEAVVVSAAQRGGALPFLGGSHELIAVVEEAAPAGRGAGPGWGEEGWGRLAALYKGDMERVHSSIRDLERELRSLRSPGEAEPACAQGWDRRFAAVLLRRHPDFLRADRARQRHMAGGLLHVEEEFPVRRGRGPHLIVVAGPTGAGKTTTVAKLAARWTLDARLKVGLITTDIYRVAAVDQIKEYAGLLGLELRIALSARAGAEAVAAFAGKDVVLVDTPGRSLLDGAGLSGVKGALRDMGPATVLLTIPATVSQNGAAEILKSFGILNPGYLILSKTDETRRFDLLTTLAGETDCPIAFITDGQQVPRDIRPARRACLAEWLLPSEDAPPAGPADERGRAGGDDPSPAAPPVAVRRAMSKLCWRERLERCVKTRTRQAN
jgi:hypothetical protein